jgi:hypothetical protein
MEHLPRKHHGPYGPRVVRIARFMIPHVGTADLIGLLHQVEERWPDLTVRDLIGAMVLAEALAMELRGSA